MKTKKRTRFLSIVLTLLMIISIVPMGIFSFIAEAADPTYLWPVPSGYANTHVLNCKCETHKGSHGGQDVGGTSKGYAIIAPCDGKVTEVKKGCRGVSNLGKRKSCSSKVCSGKISLFEKYGLSFCNGGAGNGVTITDSSNKISFSFAHMAYDPIYKVGDKVKKGDVLGFVGETGCSAGIHCHIAVKKNGKTINPMSLTYSKVGSVASGNALHFSCIKYPINKNKSDTFEITGAVYSNSKIQKVTLGVYDSNGKTVGFNALTASPNSYFYDIKNLDSKASFKKITKEGTYTYKITVKDGKTTSTFSRQFTVSSKKTTYGISKNTETKPSSLSITSNVGKIVAKDSLVTLSWNASGASRYTITVKNGSTVVKTLKDTTNKTLSFKAEIADTPYSVEMIASNSVGNEKLEKKDFVQAKIPCNVTFVDWDDTPLTAEPIKVNYGANAVVPEIPVREGYTFTGWDKSLTNITSDCTIKAQYKINTYTVKFIDSNGNTLKSEKVDYSNSATAPENKNIPTGYTFLGWSSEDYTSVKEDLNVYGIYDWGNKQLPVVVNITSAYRQEDGYYVYFDLTNYPDAITRGRAVVSLKTAEGKLVDTTESAAFSIPKNGTKTGMEVFVPCDDVATSAEVMIVNSYSSGVPISVKATSGIDSGLLYSAWSDEAPAEGTYDDVQTRTVYRYRDKETVTSDVGTKDGWNLYDTTSEWSPYGNWSSWSKTVYTKTDSRDVKSKKVIDANEYTQYKLYHYKYWNSTAQKYYYSYGSGGGTRTYQTKTVKSTEVKKDKSYEGHQSYLDSNGGRWWIESSKKIAEKSHMEYSYRTRTLIYTYHFYKWNDWSKWDTAPVTATDDRQVETKTQYRYLGVCPEDTSGETRTVSGNVGAAFAGKQLSLFIYKVDEASDFTNEFVGQQEVAADGSYSFTFKLREEPSVKTGDFTVAIGIEGSNNTMVIDTIKAPKPQYEVKFFSDGLQIGDAQMVEQGSAPVLPANPEKEGYTFVGWSADVTNIQSNVEIEANFVKNKYTVVFVDWVAETINISEYYYGDVITYSEAAQKEGYTFAGWEELGDTEAVVTDNMVLTAKYDKDIFTVTFFDFDGEEICRKTVEYGDAVEFPEEPTEGEMIFCGWEAEDDLYEITCDAYAYAWFVYEETCSIPEADIKTGEFTEAQTVTLSCPTENASIYYTTDGTDPLTDDSEDSTAVLYTAPITISKNCELKFYAACDGMNNSDVNSETYVISSGSVDSSLMTFEELPEYVVAAPGKYDVHNETGYKYKNVVSTSYEAEAEALEAEGWTYIDSSNGDWSEWSMTEPVSDGQFIETEETVPDPVDTPFFQYNHWKYYDAESDSYICSDTEIEGTDGEWETIELESSLTPSAFIGKILVYEYNGENWFYKGVITKGVVPDFMIYRYRTISKNFYKWTDWTTTAPAESETREYITDSVFRYTVPTSHLVTIHLGGEYGNINYTVFENEPVSLGEIEYDVEGYDFAGWFTDEELTNEWNIENEVVTSKLDLYPKYLTETNTVTFKDENGNVISQKDVEYGEEATAPDYTPEEGLTFLGWDSEAYKSVFEELVINAVVKPTDEVITVSLNKTSSVLYVESLLQLVGTVSPEDAENKTLTWTSSNADVAEVSETGLVTAVAPGEATITATTVDGMSASCKITVKGTDLPDSVTLSSNEIYVARYGTKQLEYTVLPATANNDVTWTSTNPAIASVDENGVITGNMAGTAAILISSADGSRRDFCLVKVVGIETIANTNIDFNNGIITGLAPNITSLDSFIEISDDNCELSFDSLGTDSIVYLTRDNEIIDAYTVVIFGDVNGDGIYDGSDSIIVNCIVNGMLSKEQVGEATYMAADCNHDGTVDSSDVALLEQAGLILASVNQSKSPEELETDSAYVEYLNLIDQSPAEETPVEETTADVTPTDEPVDEKTDHSFIEKIFNVIMFIVKLIKSFIAKF